MNLHLMTQNNVLRFFVPLILILGTNVCDFFLNDMLSIKF